MTRKLKNTERTWPTTDDTVEEAVVALTEIAPTIRLVEQQIWLDQLPYQNPEHRCIVRDSHKKLSEDARAMIGLVLHYPDIVAEDLGQTPAENSYYVRQTKRTAPYNRGRTLNYIKRERDLPPHRASMVYAELKDFVKTLVRYTRGTGYATVATGAMMEQK